MDNDIINSKFDDVDKKVDFLIELCQTIQAENKELQIKVKNLETELEKKNRTASQYDQQQAIIKSKIDGLISKLNDFSESPVAKSD